MEEGEKKIGDPPLFLSLLLLLLPRIAFESGIEVARGPVRGKGGRGTGEESGERGCDEESDRRKVLSKWLALVCAGMRKG